MAKSHYIAILCGGTGPRLWPLSRADHPKQFLNVFSDKTLLQETLDRARRIVPIDHIYIVSNSNYRHKLDRYLPSSQIILEPEKKNTAMAILLLIWHIKRIDPQAIITTMPSDHKIDQANIFISQIKQTHQLSLDRESIVTIAIRPRSNNPAFGYIVPGEKQTVAQFIEKPEPELAKKLISNKGALWNSGIYTFSIPAIETEFESLSPNLWAIYQKIKLKELKSLYHQAENISIDKAISEKSHHLLFVKSRFNWSDIGDWRSIYLQLNKDKTNFAKIGDSPHVQFNSKDVLIASTVKDKLIGLVGVKNLAIIDTPDALLVCNIAGNDSYYVRDLITQIVKNPKTKKYFLKSNNHE